MEGATRASKAVPAELRKQRPRETFEALHQRLGELTTVVYRVDEVQAQIMHYAKLIS